MKLKWALCLLMLCGCHDLGIHLCGTTPKDALDRLRDMILDDRVTSFQIMRADRERHGGTRRWEPVTLSASDREELVAHLDDCALPYHVPVDSDGKSVEFGIGFFDGKNQLLAAGSGHRHPGVDTIQMDMAVGSRPCERSPSELDGSERAPPGGPVVCWLSTGSVTEDSLILPVPPLVLPADSAEQFEIYGWGFLPEPMVFIDGLPARKVERHGYHHLTVTLESSPGILGKVPIRVQNKFAEPGINTSSFSVASLRTKDLSPPRTPCNPADCEERCEVLRVAANHWQFLDGSNFTYAIIDETNVQGGLSRQPITLASGDLNQDGRDDLITANEADNTISILISRPQEPPFRPNDAIVHKLPVQPSVLALTDLNGDHQLDLVVASATGNVLIALPNIGGRTVFGTPVELRRLNEPINLLVTNLDADEHGDVIVVQKQGQAVSIWRNPRLGSWPLPDQEIPMNPGTILGALASGRLAGDDLPDVAVADISHRRVEILRNLGNGQLQRQLGQGVPLPVPTEPTSVAIADAQSNYQLAPNAHIELPKERP
jgi:hypothetical protein